MTWSGLLPRAVTTTWRGTGLNGRLGTGIVALVLFTLAWDAMAGLVDLPVGWPVIGLVAAAGWARLGLSVRPMAVLMLLGFVFDGATLAPFGVFPVVFLTSYALLASAGLVMGGEMDPLTNTLLPFVGIGAGFAVLWGFASVLAAGPVELLPLLVDWAVCCLLYTLFEGLFDLESAKTAAKGG